jgi:NAD(P)-dependent dehydrogenase (short-subunit alcohol dehydrogenase family)
MSPKSKKLLLFGGSGQIAREVAVKFCSEGWDVYSVLRDVNNTITSSFIWDVLVDKDIPEDLKILAPFNAVCWAQGANTNDSIYSFDRLNHKLLYEANVLFILESLNRLLKNNLLAKSARLCIVSSIWQEISRQNKLSYSITKSALKGLVLSLANDLAEDGFYVNAVLPGAIDTPMTHKNLSAAQIQLIEQSTKFKRLPTLSEVVSTIYFLCNEECSGLTGQFLKVDLGFSDVRNI